MSKLTRLQVAEMNSQSSKSCGCSSLDTRVNELDIKIEELNISLLNVIERLSSLEKSKTTKKSTKEQITELKE